MSSAPATFSAAGALHWRCAFTLRFAKEMLAPASRWGLSPWFPDEAFCRAISEVRHSPNVRINPAQAGCEDDVLVLARRAALKPRGQAPRLAGASESPRKLAKGSRWGLSPRFQDEAFL